MLGNKQISYNQRKVNTTGDGVHGDNFEARVKKALGGTYTVSKGKGRDVRYKGRYVELKTGSGELGTAGEAILKGSTLVLYCPVYQSGIELEQQEAFLLERDIFIKILEELNLIRVKQATSGRLVYSIQTIWNRKQNKPHSKKKYEELIDLLYDNCIGMIDEMLEGNL